MKITLDASHRYHVSDESGEIKGEIWSVSQIVEKMCCNFNPTVALTRITPKRREEKYNGMTDSEILSEWDQNANYTARCGTIMHSFIEHRLKGDKSPIPDPQTPRSITFDDTQGVIMNITHLKEFDEYFKEYTPIAIERSLFSKELMIAGTVDYVCVDSKGKNYLFDWKRRKELNYENRKKAGIQLNLYRILIDIPIDKMFIVSIFPTNEHLIFDEIARDTDILQKISTLIR